MNCTLTRTTPDGEVKQFPRIFKRTRDAAQAAFYVLYDNGAATKSEATAFASKLQDTPIGVTLKHDSGYTFTINKEKEHGNV